MLALLVALLLPSASAQAVRAVPPGARAVTVMVCDEPDGCRDGFQAMADHCAALGLPLLDFDAVASAGPGGGEARAALDEALTAVALEPGRPGSRKRAPPTAETWRAARDALQATPLTLPSEEPLRIWLGLGDALLAEDNTFGADQAFANAASASGGRVYNLPELSTAGLARYLDIASRPASTGTLTIDDGGANAQIFLDGLPLRGARSVEVRAGWHRLTLERPARRTAWVGEIIVLPGRELAVQADLSADDAPIAMEVAVIGAIRGMPAPAETASSLAVWARGQGLNDVRFVLLSHAHDDGAPPEERITGRGWDWDVDAAWLDVAAGRLTRSGPGPATLRAAASPDRFAMGLTIGYTRLQQTLAIGADPHDHIDVELIGTVLLRPSLSLDARLGVWHSAQPYYLYENWRDRDVVPVAAGARWTFGGTGVYAGAHALAVVPFALGGELFAGWQWRPSPRWRIGLEGKGGYTDHGPLGGGGVTVAFEG